ALVKPLSVAIVVVYLLDRFADDSLRVLKMHERNIQTRRSERHLRTIDGRFKSINNSSPSNTKSSRCGKHTTHRITGSRSGNHDRTTITRR
ncbi:hypothetical protein PHYSODRAFT_494268, partial [Phytophthora sojae]